MYIIRHFPLINYNYKYKILIKVLRELREELLMQPVYISCLSMILIIDIPVYIAA